MKTEPSREARRVRRILVSILLATVLGPPILIYATNFLHLRWYLHGSLGNVDAMLQLGVVHLRRRDPPRARYWFELAAKRGNAVGMFECYRRHPDQEIAKYWLIKSGEAGLPEAMIELKDNYFWGRAGFEIDKQKGLYWATQEAEAWKKSLIKQGTSFEQWQRDGKNWTKEDRDNFPELFPGNRR